MAKLEDEYKKEAYQGAVAKATGTAAPQTSASYEGQLADLYNRIQNREDFSYDVNADPLYQQYKDQYIQGGKLAMRDTMGKAAALTGGYASTYAQQVGQQAYDGYLQNLTAQIPELYQQAYSKYTQEGNDLLQQFNLLGSMRDTAFAKEQQLWSNLYTAIGQTGYNPTDAELKAAGMTRAQANALKAMWTKANTTTATGGGGGGGGGSPKGSPKAGDGEVDLDNLTVAEQYRIALENGATQSALNQFLKSEMAAGTISNKDAANIITKYGKV